jgi:radical SAM superfamily enzyme YgiQ (UPF0313 family)
MKRVGDYFNDIFSTYGINMKKVLLVVPDNESYIHYFPLGLAYIASILRNAGHNVSIYSQDLNHWNEEHLTKIIEKHNFDIVATGSVAGYYPYKKLLKISKAINDCSNRNKFKYIIGGHMVSAAPDYFLYVMGADNIIVGEGENSILKALEGGYGVIQNEPTKDLDSLPLPAYDLFPMWYYRLQRMPNIRAMDFSASIISGRGCHFNCTFCYRMTKGIRLRSIQSIIDEISFLKKEYKINYIDFADDLTMASKQRAIELSEALLPLKIKWRCEGRLNFVDKDVLEIMKKSGCVFINYGIEALDDNVLCLMKKALCVEQIIRGVETTLDVGISPGLNVIFGNIGDTIETLNKGVDFLLKYDDGAQLRTIRPVTPYPGCELFDEAIKRGLVKDVEDFYENKHLNSDLLTCNFTELNDDEFYKALYDANLQLIMNYNKKQKEGNINQLNKLYINKDVSFRGYRHT